ncbi:hypothetical protein TRFO_23842 [Tritrichomonas foetus]|uniref:Transmembrane protein n=1 Tax=Tritrichomonas foetus TaxID=1144522 RepID=A0A1J4K8R8_9EUKA|nr:hypothetical protein TRFO_23842 [Tritrichomonas foetus]|eukprot:OHT07807.1 hypothetical protein TRFO_23842 [Tritrichomonas foetus]
MNEFIQSILEWATAHRATSVFIVTHLLLSIIFSFIRFTNQTLNNIINLFICDDFSLVAVNILFSILFSGIEASIGTSHYSFWLVWSFSFLFCFRSFFKLNESMGPTPLVFSVFLCFVFIHRPVYYFKLFKFHFSDTFLYSIGVIQYILYDPIGHLIDAGICAVANIIWKIVNLILFQNERNDQIENEIEDEIRHDDQRQGEQLHLESLDT